MIWALLLGCPGQPPPPIGGRLAACWSSPNCVSSQADPSDRRHHVAPLPLSVEPAVALQRLALVLSGLPGAHDLQVQGLHLRITCDTPSGLYTDDVDALLDPAAGVIHVRSSSRIGYGDNGVNRARIERLREAWDQR
ncbi:MAG TPA: DUF1499 domain-containing protein [Deltaproteobacteria bacterium]|nr:DUF1499 domain-containing protein [Deltaproteobacteria bacterium]